MRMLCCAAVLAAWSTLVLAEQPTEPEIRAMMAFVNQQTGLPIPAKLPRIEARTIDQLSTMDDVAALNGWPVVGAYGSGAVYLLGVWDRRRLDDQGVLIHELTHYAQDRGHAWSDCPGDLERQAFAVEQAWLTRAGSSLGAVGYTPANLDRLTRRCPH